MVYCKRIWRMTGIYAYHSKVDWINIVSHLYLEKFYLKEGVIFDISSVGGIL